MPDKTKVIPRPDPATVVNFPKDGKLLKCGDSYYVCRRKFVYSKEKKRSVEQREYLGRIAGNVFYTMDEYREKFMNKGVLKSAKPLVDARELKAQSAAQAKLMVRSYLAGPAAVIIGVAASMNVPAELSAAGLSPDKQDALLSLTVFRLLQPKLPWDYYGTWSRLRALPCPTELSASDIDNLIAHLPVNPEDLCARLSSAMTTAWTKAATAESLQDFMQRLNACCINVYSDGSTSADGLLPEDRELLVKLNWLQALSPLCAVCAKRV